MKTLVVTTGFSNYLKNTYIPSLRDKGEYNGDILIIDYDNTKQLQKSNILFLLTKRVYNCISSDRIRAFYEALKDIYQNYDVIMITDGNDIEYFKSIMPIFDIAKDSFCYVVETPDHTVKTWIKYYREYSDSDKVWNVMKDKPMINAGMMIGPSKSIMEVLEFMTEKLKCNSAYGADQLLINALIYYYKYPSKSIGFEWNYVLLCGKLRMVSPNKYGKVYAQEDGREIIIVHRNGQRHMENMDYNTWRKFVFPACRMSNEGWVNR